jgi:uroporphyrinogen-III synthase
LTESRGPGPLAGVTIVWTGSPGSAKTLFAEVERLGATVERLPVIEHCSPVIQASIDRVFSDLDKYSWVVLTSAEAARVAARRLSSGPPVAAVGPSTEAILVELGHPPTLVPETHDAASLADALIALAPVKPILFVRGEKALRTLPAKLLKAGIEVQELVVYSTRPVSRKRLIQTANRIREAADVVVMGSPSGVGALNEALSPGSIASLRAEALWVALGGSTHSALKAAGVSNAVELARVEPRELARVVLPHRNH